MSSYLTERLCALSVAYTAAELDAVYATNPSYYNSFMDGIYDKLQSNRTALERLSEQQKQAAATKVAALLAEATTLAREHNIPLVLNSDEAEVDSSWEESQSWNSSNCN